MRGIGKGGGGVVHVCVCMCVLWCNRVTVMVLRSDDYGFTQ
jgi:hypothetical protein